MSSQQVADFLTKEVLINNNIVTFRSLSRHLSIHVNTAKTELALFYEQTRSTSGTISATYLVSGHVEGVLLGDADTIRGDFEIAGEIEEDEEEPRIKQVLASQTELEDVKATFKRVLSCNVYCLSTSPLRDAGLICEPSKSVVKADCTKGADFRVLVGKIISPSVKTSAKAGKVKASSSSSAKPSVVPARPAAAQVAATKSETKAPQKAPPAPEKLKPKGSGTLDWSNARAKEPKKPEPEVKQMKTTVKKEELESNIDAKSKGSDAPKAPPGRGVKRKSDVMVQGDAKGQATEVPTPKVQAASSSKPPSGGARVNRGKVISDDEDDDEGTTVVKAKTRKNVSHDSDEEESLRAMMDVDDDEVMRVSRPSRHNNVHHDATESESEEAPVQPVPDSQDVAMDDDSDPAPKAKPRKKREKKVVPIGRNGLKKKRVVKSVTRMEGKYMVTEDYSSYESVEEEEEEEEPAKQANPKGKKKPTPKPEKNDEAKKTVPNKDGGTLRTQPSASDAKDMDRKPAKPAESKSGAKPGGPKARPGGQSKNLMNYFGGGGAGKK